MIHSSKRAWRLSRAIFVLVLVGASVFASNYVQPPPSSDTDTLFKLSGDQASAVVMAARPDSQEGSKLQIVLPKTTNEELTRQLNLYADSAIAEFKNHPTPTATEGFYSQLRIIPHLDYVSESVMSLVLQTDTYRPNKEVVTQYESWLASGVAADKIILTNDYAGDLGRVLRIDKQAVAPYIGKPLAATFLPDYKLRLYSSLPYIADAKTGKPFTDISLQRLPHIAAAYHDKLYKSYPKSFTPEQQKKLSLRYKRKLERAPIKAADCSLVSCIALTFDDGPTADVTPKVLDILTATHTPATFFVLGVQAQKYPDILKKEQASGYEIENHSFSHPDFVKLKKPDLMKKQIDDTQKELAGLGIQPKFFRPPYGSVNDMVRKSVNMPLVLWNIDSQEWRIGKDVYNTASSITKQARPGAIILMHDTRSITADSLSEVIQQLSDRGFAFVTVENLLNVDASRPAQYNTAP